SLSPTRLSSASNETCRFFFNANWTRGRRMPPISLKISPPIERMRRMKILLSCLVAIVMTGTLGFAQNRGTPGTEGRPIQGRSPAPPPPGPLVDLVKATVDAYNKGAIGYFEKLFTDD